ncbi:hypothetical protein Q5H93_06275 [Hymenobacter sp. ASUV-10]|uniref:Uncharacterized protein n=1 Tax=Hymenobacter aranciens TaxID=3063996 RepID=A0ABT9BBD7_9BACT|nr:hypothetical protein [Hymenobacter sp. ASUV-10]MDO7874332.1 hypothetical protein [Hymenobacter sp. ASUV-10]
MELIDTKYLSTYTSVNAQMDAKNANAAIQQAGQFEVEPLIGTERKATLESYLKTGDEMPTAWARLLALVKPYHALAAHYALLLDQLVEVAAKGNLQPDGTAPIEVIKLRREDIQSKLAMQRDRILTHLAANPDEFGAPDCQTAPTQHSPLILVFTPPIYFGG